MIPAGVEVFVGLEPIDLRWGFDRLAGLVSERLGRDARSRALFVFFGKRRDALKVLFFDGTGVGSRSAAVGMPAGWYLMRTVTTRIIPPRRQHIWLVSSAPMRAPRSPAWFPRRRRAGRRNVPASRRL